MFVERRSHGLGLSPLCTEPSVITVTRITVVNQLSSIINSILLCVVLQTPNK